MLAVRGHGLARELDVRADDRIATAQGAPVHRPGDLRRALLDRPGPLALEIVRDGDPLRVEGPVLSRDEILAFADDLAIVPDMESSAFLVMEGEPAERAGLRDGDRVLELDTTEISSWPGIIERVRAAVEKDRPVTFLVERQIAGRDRATFVEATITPSLPLRPDYGLMLRQDTYLYRTHGLGDSLWAGTTASWRFLQDTWLTVKRMILRDVALSNAGGIISIGAISYHQAELGWVKLFFFLCMLSINLAFLNVLPIPVLDGGHLFFLIVEKLKGSPVSERVLGYSQMVGVVLILSLLVYITYHDLVRWVF